jgi:hypothetical protein
MQLQAANSNPLSDLSRCQHRFPSRRRCRLPVSDSRSGLCASHARELQQRELADLSSGLVGQVTKFETYDDVNDVLSRLLILTSQDRVSPRRAAVIAYICNLLLRSIPAEGDKPPQIILDMQRPERDTQPQTQSAAPPAAYPTPSS